MNLSKMCHTQTILLLFKIEIKLIDQCNDIDMVYLDFSKALDKIGHSLFLDIMEFGGWSHYLIDL